MKYRGWSTDLPHGPVQPGDFPRFQPAACLFSDPDMPSDTTAEPPRPEVDAFLDADSSTFSYVVTDPDSGRCAIVDPVLDFDYAAGRTSTEGADRIAEFVRSRDLAVDWLIETHVHADHLSASPYLRRILGGRIGIGDNIGTVQRTFCGVFSAGPDFATDGSQFDHLFADGEEYRIGNLVGHTLWTPGHTPACMTHVIGDAAFVGDTLFMPDGGTARADFPGGDAGTLYDSIQKILALPDETRIFICHDYGPGGRELQYETTVGAQKDHNIHVGGGATREAFIAMRSERDAGLGMPRLIIPSVQVNMRAGQIPRDEDGHEALTVPINRL